MVGFIDPLRRGAEGASLATRDSLGAGEFIGLKGGPP
jgi:hypothetical protein